MTESGARVRRRPAEANDADVARQIHHRAFRDVVERQFGSWNEPLQDLFFDSEWSRQPHEMVLVDDRPAGYMAVEVGSDEVLVHNLVLDPDVQGSGVGSGLLSEVLDAAGVAGLPVRPQVLHENRAAQLYRRVGFREIGRTSTHTVMEWSPR